MKSSKNNGGYSLIEIMVAMVGLSLVALLLGSVLITTIKSDAAARERDYALIAAKAKMNELTMPNAQININNLLATTATAVTGSDVFSAPSNKRYTRNWTITPPRPYPITVNARLENSESEWVTIRGFLNRDDVCNTGITIPSGRPLNPRINDAATAPATVAFNVVRPFTAAPAPDHEISANDIGRLFTASLQNDATCAATRADSIAIVSATHTRTTPTTVTTQNALIVRNKNELFVNPATVPHLRANDVITAQIRLVDCAGRPTTFTAATQVTTVTLTFVAGNSFTVTFNHNHGTTPTRVPVSVNEGESVQNPGDPTRDDFTFQGWWTISAVTGGTRINFPHPVTANVEFWARWQAVPSYVVTFFNGSNNLGTVTVRGNTTILSPTTSGTPPVLSLTNNDNCNVSGSGAWRLQNATSNFNLETTVITAATTLYAHWDKIPYQVTFNLNNGNINGNTANVVVDNVNCGTVIPADRRPVNPTRTGTNPYFAGWFTAQTGGTQVDLATEIINTNNRTIWAQWSATAPCWHVGIPTEPDGNTAVGSLRFSSNNTLQVRNNDPAWRNSNPAITKANCNLNCDSYTDMSADYVSNGTVRRRDGALWIKFNNDNTNLSNLSVGWTKIADCSGGGGGGTFTITFDVNGGGSVNPNYCTGTNCATFPTPTRTGFDFGGWKASSGNNCGGTTITPYTPTMSTTIYACWTASSGGGGSWCDAITQTWTSGTVYSTGSIVKHNGIAYIKADWTDNTTVPASVDAWKQIGSNCATVITTTWNSSTTYSTVGTAVCYNSTVYVVISAMWNPSNTTPNNNATNWKAIGPCAP